MGSSEGQTYCLRWNNHKSNLVEILDALIKMESYVDCTIVVDEQIKFKAHRVVLAANSPYFQSILQDYGSMDHCYLLFPGVQAFEMRALLEYMYTGEVNVTQSQIPKIMKIAEQLEVKGLFDMHDLKEKFNKFEENPSLQNHPFNGPLAIPPAAAQTHFQQQQQRTENKEQHDRRENGSNKMHLEKEHQQSSPIITTSTTNVTAAQSSSSSPPHTYKSPYSSLYTKSPGPSTSERQHHREREQQQQQLHHQLSHQRDREEREREREQHSQQWPISPILPHGTIPSATAAAMLSSVYESAPDMNPLKRKKLSSISSMLMSRDTPILRNVLAQSHAADSSQAMPLILPQQQQLQQPPERSSKSERSGSDKSSSSINCSSGLDYSAEKKYKYEEPHSPFTDKSFEDDNDMPPSFPNDFRPGSQSNSQKPEWKRYKQYTRNDILAAIDCVRNGMSALQASRKFGVPSRTLYDKVKKMGITTGRPMNRTVKRSPSTGGSGSAAFPFGLSGASPYGQSEMLLQYSEEKERSDRELQRLPPNLHQHPAAAALLDRAFLQQAFESRGGDIAGREALYGMALVAATHAAVNGARSTSPGTNGTARSPSPSFAMKFSRQSSPLPPAMHRDSTSIMVKREFSDRELEHDMEREREMDREREMEREREMDRERERERSTDHEREIERERDINHESEYEEKETVERKYAFDENDHVEDLSVSKSNNKVLLSPPSPIYNSPPPSAGVIVPPMLKLTLPTSTMTAPDEFTRNTSAADSKSEILTTDESSNRD